MLGERGAPARKSASRQRRVRDGDLVYGKTSIRWAASAPVTGFYRPTWCPDHLHWFREGDRISACGGMAYETRVTEWRGGRRLPVRKEQQLFAASAVPLAAACSHCAEAWRAYVHCEPPPKSSRPWWLSRRRREHADAGWGRLPEDCDADGCTRPATVNRAHGRVRLCPWCSREYSRGNHVKISGDL